MNICWNFPGNNDGKISGISEAGIETFRGDLLKSLAKEICQNSLDAVLDSKKRVLIEFKLYNIPLKEDKRISGLEENFNLAKNYWQDNEKTMRFLEKAEKNFKKEKIRVLRISDYNTTGLTGSDKKKNSTWNNLVKSTGVSDKTGSSGGSYGIGKSAPFACSDLRTLFYNTLDEYGLEAFQGVANLVSFEKGDIVTQGTGYYGNSKDNTAIRNMDSFGGYTRKESGTDIYIIGFLDDDEWKKKIVEAVLENFLISILNDNIEIKVEDVLINKENLSFLMEKYKEDIELTYEYYQVLMEKDSQPLEINFRDLGKFKLYLLIKKDFKRKILISRSNGMKIFDRNRISSSIQFSGVCILEDEKINAYFREMETPQHDNWESDRHSNPKEAEKIKKEFFRILREKVKEKGKESITDEMDAVGMGEYLPDIQDISSDSENKKENIENGKKTFECQKITTLEAARNSTIEISDENKEENYIDESSEKGEIENEVPSEGDFNLGDKKSGTGNGAIGNGEKLDLSKFSHIHPSSIRIFKVSDENDNEVYKMIFKLNRNTKNAVIEVSIAGEDRTIPIIIKSVKNENGEILESKNNRIDMKNLLKDRKYSILFSLNGNENYPVEVKIYGDKI